MDHFDLHQKQKLADQLHEAVRSGRIYNLEPVLAAGADPNFRYKHQATALMLCMDFGQNIALPMVQRLIEAGANVHLIDVFGDNLLVYAASCRPEKPEIVKLLLKHGMNPNQHTVDYSPLGLAATKGYVVTLNILLAHGAAVNWQRYDGKTALMAAAEAGNTECVKALLKAGAEIGARTQENKTALMFAREKGQVATVALLERECLALEKLRLENHEEGQEDIKRGSFIL